MDQVNSSNECGNVHDDEYDVFLTKVQNRFIANLNESKSPLFTTDAEGMWLAYLDSFSLGLIFGAPSIEIKVAWGINQDIIILEFAGEGVDKASAMRKAIVRAAAEVGKRKLSKRLH